MTTVQHYQNNVVTLHNPAAIAREKARAETMSVEQAIQDNADQFHGLISRAARTALSSGSHIFAPYNDALAVAERAVKDAQERLQLATTLFGKQLEALDQAKSEHDAFVKTVQAQTETDTDHQRDLKQAKRIGNEILTVKKQLRLLRDRHQVRMNIMKIENPFVWALYKNKIDEKETSSRTLFKKMIGNVSAWLKGTKTFRSGTLAVKKIDGQIEDANQTLTDLHADLNKMHDGIFRVRNENLERISQSHLSVENAQRGFSAAESLKETVALELSVCKQTLISLQTWDHPVAKSALEQFTDIVMTASRTGGNETAVVFLMGSKQLADDLIAKIRDSDLEEYDLIAELHYSEEAEALIQQASIDVAEYATASLR